MNTVGEDDTVVELLMVPVPVVAITCEGVVCDGALLGTIVVACGTDTVRKTAPPLVAIVVVVLPFSRGLPTVGAGCTSVTLMGVTFGFDPEVRCCMAL